MNLRGHVEPPLDGSEAAKSDDDMETDEADKDKVPGDMGPPGRLIGSVYIYMNIYIYLYMHSFILIYIYDRNIERKPGQVYFK
jgi:hypothetical protein